MYSILRIQLDVFYFYNGTTFTLNINSIVLRIPSQIAKVFDAPELHIPRLFVQMETNHSNKSVNDRKYRNKSMSNILSFYESFKVTLNKEPTEQEKTARWTSEA